MDNENIPKEENVVKKRSFWTKLKDKIKAWFNDNFKNHKWRILGWFCIWILPLCMLCTYIGIEQYHTNTQTGSNGYKITYEWWVILVLIIMLIIYFKKLRQVIRDKKLASNIKGIPINPIYHLLDGVGTCGSIGIVYWVVYMLNKIRLDTLLNYIMIVLCSVGFGYICLAIDSINTETNNDVNNQQLKK